MQNADVDSVYVRFGCREDRGRIRTRDQMRILRRRLRRRNQRVRRLLSGNLSLIEVRLVRTWKMREVKIYDARAESRLEQKILT